MSDETVTPLSGKVSFGVDYINLLGLMNLRAKTGMNPVSHAAILMFLVEWGLTAEELDQANRVFWQQVEQKTIDTFEVSAKRITTALLNHPVEQRRMMVQLAAVAEMDADLTQEEIGYLKGWGEAFDMRPSEISTLYDRGRQLALGLSYFGRKFMETKLSEHAAHPEGEAAAMPPESHNAPASAG